MIILHTLTYPYLHDCRSFHLTPSSSSCAPLSFFHYGWLCSASPPTVSCAMLCFYLFSSSQTSEVPHPFPSLSASSSHLRSQTRLAFQLTMPIPEHAVLWSISYQGPLTFNTHSHCFLLPSSRSLNTSLTPSVRAGGGWLCRSSGKMLICSCSIYVAQVLTLLIYTFLIQSAQFY